MDWNAPRYVFQLSAVLSMLDRLPLSRCTQTTAQVIPSCPPSNPVRPARHKVFLSSVHPTPPPSHLAPSAQPDAANFWLTAAAQGHSLPFRQTESLQTVPDRDGTNLHCVWIRRISCMSLPSLWGAAGTDIYPFIILPADLF